MSVAVEDRPLVLGTGHGGMPARRAVARWAWRLFRREWRQQSLVLALLVIAVAATTVGLAVAANAPSSQASSFGTATHRVTLTSTGTQLDADVAALRGAFGTAEVIGYQKLPVPGSANTVDLRAQDPHGPYGRSMLRLNAGRYPQGPDEIAVTDRVAKTFDVHLGGTWDEGGRHRTVVGLVENPLNLLDRFALVAPGQATPADRVTVLIRATPAEFGRMPRPDGASIEARGTEPGSASSVPVLLLATIGLLFVGLLAAAGFTVMAQRRLRALGMLGAIGASHRHIRLVLVANGAVLGAVGALAGTAVGLAGWFLVGPRLESLIGHRIDRFDLPWLPLVAAMLLAVLTAVGASWWPAHAAARVPVVAALSGRPVPPRPARRFAALGGVLLLGGLAALVAAQQTRPGFIIGGVVATAVGLLLLAPLGIAALGRLARLVPLAPRLALRDLARHRARSSAALAAIGLAVGIAAAVALSAGVNVARTAAPTGGNLPSDQLIVWVAEGAASGPVPTLTPAQADAARQRVDAIAVDLGATTVVPLQAAVAPNGPEEHLGSGERGRPLVQFGIPHRTTTNGRTGTEYRGHEAVPLFLATPELLGRYGVDPTSIGADTDVITRRSGFDGYDLLPFRDLDWHPKLHHASLPAYTSLPDALITTHAVQSLRLTPIPVGWLIQAPRPLTQARIDRAQQTALTAGLSVEARPTGADVAQLANRATGTGIAVALGVLAMTVGLIRSESARDLRTLTAAGARRGTRRALTAATSGALALLGAVIGTAGAYLALLAWYHREPHWLGRVPVLDLAAILIGLPLVAYAGAWLLAGKEPSTAARGR
jgi:putative ABC transport system permease protein